MKIGDLVECVSIYAGTTQITKCIIGERYTISNVFISGSNILYLSFEELPNAICSISSRDFEVVESGIRYEDEEV